MEFLSTSVAFQSVWLFAKTWWWIFLPLLLWRPFVFFWFYWRNEEFNKREPRIVLEVKVPPEVEKPIKAMESVWAGFWQMYDPPNLREKVLEGEFQLGLSIELVSTEGQVHFYIRIPESQRRLIDSAVYAQFPNAEIELVEDYVKALPRNIPNKDWRMWGAMWKLDKADCYPIKTYRKFFEENPDTVKEEKRVDPMAMLVEALSKLGEGEHIWIQLMVTPFAPDDNDYVKRSRKLVDTLVRRPEPAKPPSVWQDMGAVGTTLATGQPPAEAEMEEIREIIPPEMKLTPGEREIVASIEEKLGKPSFNCVLQFIYAAKIEKYDSAAKALAMSYFQQFSTVNMNFFRPLQTTKVHTITRFFLDKRRGYVRRRRLFWRYSTRDSPYHPRPGGSFVLNIEELASFFHFPSKAAFPASSIPRVETKKAEAPPGLPTE